VVVANETSTGAMLWSTVLNSSGDTGDIYAICINAAGTVIYVGDCVLIKIYMVSAADGSIIARVDPAGDGSCNCVALCISPDGSTLWAPDGGGANGARLFAIDTGTLASSQVWTGTGGGLLLHRRQGGRVRPLPRVALLRHPH
jgi:hypothetical protein